MLQVFELVSFIVINLWYKLANSVIYKNAVTNILYTWRGALIE